MSYLTYLGVGQTTQRHSSFISCRKWWMLSLMWMTCLQMVLQSWGTWNIWNAAAEAQRSGSEFDVWYWLMDFNDPILCSDDPYSRSYWFIVIHFQGHFRFYQDIGWWIHFHIHDYEWLLGAKKWVVLDSERPFCPGCGCGAICRPRGFPADVPKGLERATKLN